MIEMTWWQWALVIGSCVIAVGSVFVLLCVVAHAGKHWDDSKTKWPPS